MTNGGIGNLKDGLAKEYSYIENGVAWGAWGSNIARSRRYYKDYKNKSKFTAFVDRWQPLIFS